MANENLPAIVLNINDPQLLITETLHGKPAILSTQIAERFLKRHDHILRDIGNLRGMLPKSFDVPNFGAVQIKDKKGEKRKAFLLTRDAFTLLVMGMTGKTAVIWKIRYIEAFNALEKAAADRLAERSAEAAYLAGRQEALSLPVMEAERKKGYLDGMREGKRIAARRDKLDALVKIRHYQAKGLTSAEIGKLLDMKPDTVRKRISRARKLGFWPARQESQAILPGVA